MDSKAAFVTLFVVLLISTRSSLSHGLRLLDSQFGALATMPASGWVDTTGWHNYESEKYGFQIEYPDDFILADRADDLVVSGAVVTFIPTYDPSLNRSDAKTNLRGFSVTIGVTDASRPLSGQNAPNCTYVHERRLEGQREVGSVRFTRHYFAEGAAGNQYEKLSYRTAFGVSCYEIALFVHYGSPCCYSPGAIKIFDPTEILRLFDTMAGTFVLSTGDRKSSK